MEELGKEPTGKGFTVNYFEKDPKTGETRRLPDTEGEEDDDSLMDDFEDIEASSERNAEKLQATLDKLSKTGSILEKILAKHGPPGAIDALNRALASFDNKNDALDDIGTYLIQVPPVVFENPNTDMSKVKVDKVNAKISLLNRWLNKAMEAIQEKKLSSQQISRTWSYFGFLIPFVVKSQVHIPNQAWYALWTVFSWEGPVNPSRMAHIHGLSKAMIRIGVPLSDEQQLLAIEAAFVGGDASGALTTWKRQAPILGDKKTAAIAYWELGVRMWSAHGDTERAERASKALLDRASSSSPVDSRVLLHLIQAYCKEAETAEKGFQLYRRMRSLATKVGKPMEISDYDDIISLFLMVGHTDYAMYAFTDMMLAGTVDLYGKSKLPSSVKNHFFFGKWLKRLIGAGDLDGAFNVLIFMQKNGVMPASVQVNGLAGAWLRSGTTENRKKAEKLTWAMVQSRKAFVGLRHRNLSTEWPMRLKEDQFNRRDEQSDDLDYTMVPRASIETFVLLAENYRERGLFGQLEELFVAYKECEMSNDALMMNELMMAAVAQRRGDKARELYELMVHEHDIIPNADTFTIMFSSLPVNMLHLPAIKPHDAAESSRQARIIFCDLISSTWVFQDAKWRTKKGLLSEGQVKLILHSFRKAGDFAGLMAALEGLRDVMHFQITRNVLLEMIAEYENIDRPSARTSRVVVTATLRLQKLVEDMHKRRGIEGIAPEAVKDPNMLYRILLDYYYTKLQQTYVQDGIPAQMLIEAREDLGVKWTHKKDAQRRMAEVRKSKK